MNKPTVTLRGFDDSKNCDPAAAQAPDIEFRLRTARLLAELHGESLLSEQQCARHMRIDLVSWRKLEDCFGGGFGLPEGAAGAMPTEDSESVLREAMRVDGGSA